VATEQIRDIARQVVANMGLEGGIELAAQWCGQRYQELCGSAKFRHLRQYGQFYLPAPLQTGTCTITVDNPTVTFDSTALASFKTNAFFKFPTGFLDLWFRPQIGTSWYRIIDATNAGVITLETPFAQDNGFLLSSGTVQSDVPFYIIPRYQNLAPNARQLGVFLCDFLFRALKPCSEDDLNRWVPNRFLVSTYPQYIAELNSNLKITGLPKQVEIYPYPQQSVTMHYTYWATPPYLEWSDYLPPTIDPDVIRTGAMIDACTNKAGKAVRMGRLQEAGYWRSEAARLELEWAKKKARAHRTDRGEDDVKFILMQNRWLAPLDFDPIQDAYQNFLAQGY